MLDYLFLGGRNLAEKAEDGVVITQVAAVRAATDTWLPDLTFLDLVDNGTTVTEEVLNIRAFPEPTGRFRCEAVWRRNVTALLSWPGLSFRMFVRSRIFESDAACESALVSEAVGPALCSHSGHRISRSGRSVSTERGASPPLATKNLMTPGLATRTRRRPMWGLRIAAL